MRIGLPGTGTTAERIIGQAERAEADGFTTLWYASAVLGDPLVACALAGRVTSTLEVGTAIAPTYPCHPVLQAGRASAAVTAIGASGRLTVGVGPSHRPFVEDVLGIPYDTPGRHTEEYVQILAPLLRGEAVAFEGKELRAQAGPPALADGAAIPVLVSALAPRMLRVAGAYTAGTITWMANAAAIGDHVAPLIRSAADDAGRPPPRIVVGLPVAVHDDAAAAREVANEQFGAYGTLPNYQRILARGGIEAPGDAAIVGDEAQVARGIRSLVDAGATDVWAAPFPVGDDRTASRSRTRAVLRDLVSA